MTLTYDLEIFTPPYGHWTARPVGWPVGRASVTDGLRRSLRRADSRPKMSAATARRSVRVGGGGATNLAAAAARRDRLRALVDASQPIKSHGFENSR